MSGEETVEDGSASEPQAGRPDQAEPEEILAGALARVQDAVVEMKEGELRQSLEAAIETIDTARETQDAVEGDPLGPVADALEGALEELERGKVANLLPAIEQAQSIVQS